MVKFTEIINASIEWTATVLFRPFSLKKWLLLAFVAFLAGHMASGGNSGSGGSSSSSREKSRKSNFSATYQFADSDLSSQESAQESSSDIQELKEILNKVSSQLKNPLVLSLVCLAGLILLAFIVLMIWLNSRFEFIFLQDLTRNDASIKIPFRENKKIGNSLFFFNLVYTVISVAVSILPFLMCFMSLKRLGVFDKAREVEFLQIFLTCLPFVLFFLLIILLSAIIHFVKIDFALMVMFKDRINALPAFRKAFALIKSNKLDVFKYFFVKIGLYICCYLVAGILSFIALLGMVFPLGIIGTVFYFIFSKLLPTLFAIIIVGLYLLVALPVVIVLMFALGLPFAVFLRTVSIKFVGRLEPRYDLFSFTNEEVSL